MGKYLLRRFANYVVLIFIAVSITYFLAGTQLRPRDNYKQRNPPVPEASINEILNRYNVNDKVPVFQRYLHWLQDVFTKWNWGYSAEGASVNDEISRRIWVSFRLVVLGWLLGVIVGVSLGAWTATRQYSIPDRVVTFITLLFIATPTYVLIPVIQLIVTNINNATGVPFQFIGEYSTGKLPDYPLSWLVDRIQHLLLPTLTLTILGMAGLSRVQRNLMLDALGSDYVRTARAKGLSEPKAVVKHALRTALIPTGTYFAFGAASIFVGATFTEKLFGFHGMGEYGILCLTTLDIHGMVGVAAFAGVCYLVGAILADFFVAILDPRVRLS